MNEVNTLKEVRNNWPAGIKRTRQREGVLSILENSEKPLSATDICSEMEKGGGAAWLSTVYRILELFVKKGVVIKTNVMNNEMAVYELNRFKHKHYAVCMNCRKIITMDNCPMEKFIPKLEDEDFQVLGHNLEVFGFCKDCSPA
jgi:Fe2+ or Zn2+ uptake regulation protein